MLRAVAQCRPTVPSHDAWLCAENQRDSSRHSREVQYWPGQSFPLRYLGTDVADVPGERVSGTLYIVFCNQYFLYN